MSLDFSQDYEAPIVTTSLTPLDDGEGRRSHSLRTARTSAGCARARALGRYPPGSDTTGSAAGSP